MLINDLMNTKRNFKKQKDNYLLAEEVYTVTTDRYQGRNHFND